MTSEDVENITIWAVAVAEKHHRGIMEVVAKFKELESTGTSIECAKREIEKVYAS